MWSDSRSKKTTNNSYSDTKIETDFENYTNDVWSSEPTQNSLEKEEDKNSEEETVEENPEKETKITPPKKENSIKSSFLDLLDAAEEKTSIPKEVRPVKFKQKPPPKVPKAQSLLVQKKQITPISQLKTNKPKHPQMIQKGFYRSKNLKSDEKASDLFFSGKSYKPDYETERKKAIEDKQLIEQNAKKLQIMNKQRAIR